RCHQEGFMATSRLLLLSLITAACVAQAAAQSSVSNPASSTSTSNFASVSKSPTFTNTASLSNTPSITDLFFMPDALDEFNLTFDSTAQGRSVPEKTEASFGRAFHLYKKNMQHMQSENVCLAIRSYRVVRDDPQSDATRAAGYSTCQPAAQYQLKTAVESTE